MRTYTISKETYMVGLYAIKELTDTCIVGWKDGEVHSLTAIRVNKNGKVSYGRTVKY